MEWKSYKRSFTKEALKSGLSISDIDHALNYAFILFEKGLPIIYDVNHFSLLVGYSQDYLYRASNDKAKLFYREFKIPKKRKDEYRIISEPLPSLKEIQRWILDNILYNVNISKYAKGFAPNRSIRDNARFHLRQRLVLSVDIKDFFPSIGIGFVNLFFKKLGYSNSLSMLFSNLLTLKGELPQGAPTSPALSNLFMRIIDDQIAKYSVVRKIRYTRYADDLTFSGDFNHAHLLAYLKSIFRDYNLTINDQKTKIMKTHQRQYVTGVIVNDQLRAPREIRRKLRQEIYYISKFGIEGHIRKIGETRTNYVEHLKGLADYVLFIYPADRDALFLKNTL